MTTSNETPSIDDESVIAYLRRMGYRQAERLLQAERRVGSPEDLELDMHLDHGACIAPYALISTPAAAAGANSSPEAVAVAVMDEAERAFEALASWAHGSLDAFRSELTAVLYPIAVHVLLEMVVRGVSAERRSRFAAHALDVSSEVEAAPAQRAEMQRLAALPDASHLRENALAAAFRTYKYVVTLSPPSFSLLMAYLQDAAAVAAAPANGGPPPAHLGAMVLLKIVNQFLHVRVASDDDAQASDGLTGIAADAAAAMNNSSVQWGVHAVDPDVDAALLVRARAEGTRVMDLVHGPLAMLKRTHAQSAAHAPAERLPRPPAGAAETSAELDRLRNMLRRAVLSPTGTSATATAAAKASVLPSICMYTLQNAHDRVTSADFSASGMLLATGSADSYIDVWALDHGRVRALMPSTELAAMDIDDFRSLEPFREREGAPTRRLVGHGGPVYAVRFAHPEGHRLLVSASHDGTARLWSLDTLSCVAVFRGHALPVWDVDVAPPGCGPYVVTASADRTARLWSTLGGLGDTSSAARGAKSVLQPLRVLVGHLSDVDVVRFHPNGNYVLTGSSDRSVRMWDLLTGACVRVFAGHASALSALRVSPDGRTLIAGDRAGHLRIWDIAEGRLVRIIVPPAVTGVSNSSATACVARAVTALDYDRDGRVLVSAGLDGVVRVWDAARIVAPSSGGDDLDSLVASYPTRQTPLMRVNFTARNVLLAVGPFRAD